MVGLLNRLRRSAHRPAGRGGIVLESLEHRVLLDSTVVFNEIMYNPAGTEESLEWIELHNQMAVDMDVSNWSIRGGVEFDFAEGTLVDGGGYLVVAADPAALATAAGFDGALGPFAGRLANGGEELLLLNNDARQMNRVEYGDNGHWPVGPDGGGPALAKRDEYLASEPAESWTHSVQLGGTPGEKNFPDPAEAPQVFEPLLSAGNAARVLVPTQPGDLPADWPAVAFDDQTAPGWFDRTTGIGFDTSGQSAVGDLIDQQGQIGPQMAGLNASAFVRIPFDVDDPSAFDQLSMAVDYDDGFVAYLNGVEVARRNAPEGALAFDAKATQAAWGAVPPVSDGLQLWLDATDMDADGTVDAEQAVAPYSDGNAVTVWNDKSGNACDARSNGAPTYATDGIGGTSPAVRFGGDAAGQRHSLRTSLTVADTFTIVAVAQEDGRHIGGIVGHGPGDAGDLQFGDVRTAGSDYNNGLWALWSANHNVYGTGAAPVDQSPGILSAMVAGPDPVQDWSVFKNGVGGTTTAQYSSAPVPNARIRNLHVGAAKGDGEYWDGDIAEILVYDRVLSGSEHDRIVSYLADKYGISVSATGTVIDDGDTGFDFPGATRFADMPNRDEAMHDDIVAAQAPDATATWTPGVEGTFYLQAHWTTSGTYHEPDAVFTVNHVGGTTVLPAVDQRHSAAQGAAGSLTSVDGDGSGWFALGSDPFTLDADSTVTLTKGAGGSVDWLVADALRIGEDLIIDEFSAAVSYGNTNDWAQYPVASGDPQSTQIAYTRVAGASATYTPGVAGRHRLDLSWSCVATDRTAHARYRIDLDGDPVATTGDQTEIVVDQRQLANGSTPATSQQWSGWFRVPGTFDLTPASVIVLDNQEAVGSVLIADGVRVAPAMDPEPPAWSYRHETIDLTGHVADLAVGTNVLAVQGLNVDAADADFLIRPELSGRLAPATEPPIPSLVFNEMAPATDDPFWLEIANAGDEAVSLEGFVLTAGGATGGEYVFPDQEISAGALLVVAQAELGFDVFADDKFFLYTPGKQGLLDARVVTDRLRGRSTEHAGDWLYPDVGTPGAANSFDFTEHIVINEVMYHAFPQLATSVPEVPFEESPEEWVELYNRGSTAVDLTGWTLEEGIEYGFAAGTMIGPGEYLVVAKNAAAMAARYPAIDVVGDFSRSLSNASDLIVLKDGNKNPADRVRYYDGGRWPGYADGGGASLELRDPDADNSLAEAWAASNESGKSTWQTYSYRGVAAAGIGPENFNELVLGLLDAGEVLLDDVSVVEDPDGAARQLIQNGSFEPGVIPPEPETVTPVAVPYSSGPSYDYSPTYTADKAIDGNPGTFSCLWDDTLVPGSNPGGKPIDGDPPVTGHMIFDLGEPVELAGVKLISRADAAGPYNPRNVDFFYFADDDAANNPLVDDVEGDEDIVLIQNHSFAGMGSGASESVQWDGVVARYVGMRVNTSFESGGTHNNYQIGEIEFLTPALEPPPEQQGTSEKWRLLGNHGQSRAIVDPDDAENHVFHLIATGNAEHLSNHAETTLKDGTTFVAIANGTEYEISYRAKWLAGSSQLNSRLYFNRLPKTTLLDVPDLHGTPGMQNSRWESNIGPVYDRFRHEPVVPGSDEDVTVSVFAADPDGVASLALWYSVDGGAWNGIAMSDDGDGSFSGTISAQAASAVVQFYVEGQDASGIASLFPPGGPDSRALYRVQDGQARLGEVHNLRVIMTEADADLLHANTNLMSNDHLGATVVYDESHVYYDVGIRLKGSVYGRPFDQWVSYIVHFHPDNRLRGVHKSVSVDRSSRGPAGSPGVDEILMKHAFNHAGGVANNYDDVIWAITPRSEHTSFALLGMARYGNGYLDSQYDAGGDSPLHDFDGTYHLTRTVDGDVESLKVVEPGPITYTDIRDLGDDKELYRLHWQPKNNRAADDFQSLVEMNKAFDLTGAALDEALAELIDVDQWMRHYAMLSLGGPWDTYTHRDPSNVAHSLAHNLRVYRRPGDDRMVSLPFDMDSAFQRPVDSPLWGYSGWNLVDIIERPHNSRLFLGHLHDLINTTYNTGYMSYWTDHYGSLSGKDFGSILSYVDSRASYVMGQLPLVIPAVPFEITTNGGADLSVDQSGIEIEGNGWIDVREIRLAGGNEPLDVTWIDGDSWRLTVPLAFGPNVIELEVYDFQGALIAGDSIAVDTTATERPVLDFLRITEVNYHPHSPTATELAQSLTLQDDSFEFIELWNAGSIGTDPLDLAGVRLTDGVLFDFTGGDVTSLGPGQFVLVVRDRSAFEIRYGEGLPIAGEFELDTGLRNGGETIRLLDADGAVVHDFRYDDNANEGWPSAADGLGNSLEVVNTSSDYSDPATWYASPQEGGSPGAAAAPAVLERSVFYNGSAFDAIDDGAIATDKKALLPGQVATFGNVTNYNGGINGLFVDLAHAPDAALLGVGDLALSVGSDDDPAGWENAPTATLELLAGGGRGGSDRLVITWRTADAPKNTWLEATIPGGLGWENTTGLLIDDVFYFGNAAGETGNDPAGALVNAADVIAIRDNPRGSANPASIDNPYDINRDASVDATDMILARNSAASPLSALRLIAPSTASAPPTADAESRIPPPSNEREPTPAPKASANAIESVDRLMDEAAVRPNVESLFPAPTLAKLLHRLRG